MNNIFTTKCFLKNIYCFTIILLCFTCFFAIFIPKNDIVAYTFGCVSHYINR